MHQPPALGPVSGTWFVVRTTLPFWRTRANPSVTYAPLPDGRVVDTVRYSRRGATHLVHGLDEPLPDGVWRWRGTSPLTRLASSRWRVLHAEEDWAVTHFERTLFTPPGWDVYSRSRLLTPEDEARARTLLEPLVDLAWLFTPEHDDP